MTISTDVMPDRATVRREALTTASFQRIRTVLDAARQQTWSLDRSVYHPQFYSIGTLEKAYAVALVSHRRGTAYRKIVDIVGSSKKLARAVAEAIIADARHENAACVKWELRNAESQSLAEELGFAALPAPIPSGPGTETPPAGAVLWLGEQWWVRELPYYRQTTNFTCGAVASLIGTAALGKARLTSSRSRRENHDTEMAVWRAATSFFPCEPLGVSVAVHTELLDTANQSVEVWLDTDQPFFVADSYGTRSEFRAQIQNDFRRQVVELGIPLHAERISITEIASLLEESQSVALLLIMQSTMHPQSSAGHWVVAHSPHDGVLMIQDPWSYPDRGDTWVDASLLPVPFETVDAMTIHRDPECRGVVMMQPNRGIHDEVKGA